MSLIQEVLGSNLCLVIGSSDEVFRVSSRPPDKCWDSTRSCAMIPFFHCSFQFIIR